MFMKTFNLAVSRKKRNNHIVNIVILTALYFMGFWLGKHYVQRYSPYTVAYFQCQAKPKWATSLIL